LFYQVICLLINGIFRRFPTDRSTIRTTYTKFQI